MSDDVRALFDIALQLSEQDRAQLAGLLLESIDEQLDTDSQAAWSDEIALRLEELSSGAVTPIPWEEVRRRLHKNAG